MLLGWLEASNLHVVFGLLVIVLASSSALLVMITTGTTSVVMVVVVWSLIAALERLLFHGGMLGNSVFLLGPVCRLRGPGALTDNQFLKLLEDGCPLCT